MGEHNFWGGPTYVHGRGYVRSLDNDGSMDYQALRTLTVAHDRVDPRNTLAWHTQAGDVVDEERALAFVVPATSPTRGCSRSPRR